MIGSAFGPAMPNHRKVMGTHVLSCMPAIAISDGDPLRTNSYASMVPSDTNGHASVVSEGGDTEEHRTEHCIFHSRKGRVRARTWNTRACCRLIVFAACQCLQCVNIQQLVNLFNPSKPSGLNQHFVFGRCHVSGQLKDDCCRTSLQLLRRCCPCSLQLLTACVQILLESLEWLLLDSAAFHAFMRL